MCLARAPATVSGSFPMHSLRKTSSKPGRGPVGSQRLRRLLLGVVALSFTALAIVAYEADLLRSLELSTVNTRFQIRGSRPRPRDAVLVEIDEKSFGALRLQWPFPRQVHGQVIANIAR